MLVSIINAIAYIVLHCKMCTCVYGSIIKCSCFLLYMMDCLFIGDVYAFYVVKISRLRSFLKRGKRNVIVVKCTKENKLADFNVQFLCSLCNFQLTKNFQLGFVLIVATHFSGGWIVCSNEFFCSVNFGRSIYRRELWDGLLESP